MQLFDGPWTNQWCGDTGLIFNPTDGQLGGIPSFGFGKNHETQTCLNGFVCHPVGINASTNHSPRVCRPFLRLGIAPRQQPHRQRRPGYQSNLVCLRHGYQFIFDAAVQQIVG